jgi:hypothetical protein
MYLAWVRFRVWDLWAAHGRKNRQAYKGVVRRMGPELYDLVRATSARRAINFTREPSYLDAFIMGALPSHGRLITYFTDGVDASQFDQREFMPAPFLRRESDSRDDDPKWIRRNAKTKGDLSDVPDASADLVVINDPDEMPVWAEEAWRVSKAGWIVSWDGRDWRIHAKGTEGQEGSRIWCDPH